MLTRQNAEAVKHVEIAKIRLKKAIRKHTEQSVQTIAEGMDNVGQLAPVGVLPPCQ